MSGFRINFSKEFTPMMMTAQTQHDACKGGGAGGRGQQIVSLSTSQRGGTVTGEMRDLANIRLLSEAEGRVSVRGDKISSFSSSFFFSPL